MRGDKGGEALKPDVVELCCLTVPVTSLPRHSDNFVFGHSTFSLNPLGANLLKHVSHFQRNTPLLAGTLCDATLTRQD
jgi:hypothetical protein